MDRDSTHNVKEGKVASADDSEERRTMIRDSVERFIKGDDHVRRSRMLRESTPGYDKNIWKQMAGMGWLGVQLPERFGGLGLGLSEMTIIAEGAGQALLPEPFTAGAVLAAGAILHSDNDTLKAELLMAVVLGDLLPAMAWRDDRGPLSLMQCQTRAAEAKGRIRFQGKKCLVISGAGADGFVVTAEIVGGVALFWVPADIFGANISHSYLPDGRLVSRLDLEGIEVSADNMLAGPSSGQKAFTHAFDDALIIAAAELVGCSTRLLDITMDYLKVRTQFGRPIGAFQSLQHRAADLYIQLRICRHSLDDILGRLDGVDVTGAERSALASRIKARCSDVGLAIGKDAVQMHGAMGYSDECDVGLYLKRVISLSMWLGNSDFHRKRYARHAIPEISSYYGQD